MAETEVSLRKGWNSARRNVPARAVALALVFTLTLGWAGNRCAPAQLREETEAERVYRTSMESADQKIVAEEHAHSELMRNLEYLTAEIGPRLTGSEQMRAASTWALKRFEAYGIAATLETIQVPHAFIRGADTSEITSPIERHIGIRSLGWSKATRGVISANVVILESQTSEAIAAANQTLKGAIVLLGRPSALPADMNPENAYDATSPRQRGIPSESARSGTGSTQALAAAGAVVVLRDSGKTDSLFNMSNGDQKFQPSSVPIAFVTHEDYGLLYRLAQKGQVTMKVGLNGKFSDGPADTSSTWAEIKGSEFPDERVIIGGHLDSWDLGEGALDNGTGAMAVLEAARTLKALGWRPKRTITFVLFTGEEQGHVGAEAFLRNHANEIPRMDAALIDDTGTGKIISISLENLYETAPLMVQIYRPLEEILDLQPLSTRYFGQSDHVEFLRVGVPAYFCIQEPAHYREAHHTQADTFDKVMPEQVNEGAALLAAWAWNVSEFPQALPHHAAVSAVVDR